MNGRRYFFRCKNNSKRATLYGRQFIVLLRMKQNSAIVEFVDNKQREVISRNCMRKVKHTDNQAAKGEWCRK